MALAWIVGAKIGALFAIDLSDPTNPTVKGHLEIPGFSTYMHPLDATHLLTIGRSGQRDGTCETTPEGGTVCTGVVMIS